MQSAIVILHSSYPGERTCGLAAMNTQYLLAESAPFGWHLVEYGWDVGLGFTPVGAIDLWSDNSSSEIITVAASMPNSTVVLSEGEPLVVELLDERPVTASLRWNSTQEGCLGGGTGSPSLWKNGSQLRLGLSNPEKIEVRRNCWRLC